MKKRRGIGPCDVDYTWWQRQGRREKWQMGWFVVLVGLLHVGIGFGLALWLARRLAVPVDGAPALTLPAIQPAQPSLRPEPPPPPPPREGDLPLACLDKLHVAAAKNAFSKTALQVLRLDVAWYREQLVQVDERLRQLDACQGREALEPALAQLQKVNAAFLADHALALEQLQSRRSEPGNNGGLAERLEAVMLQQAAQIESTSTNLSGLSPTCDARASRLLALQEVCRLLALVHRLRDELNALLLAIVVQEGWLQSLDRKLLVDPVLQMPNRVGLAAALNMWWRDDPARCRLASMAMLKIDQLGTLNLTHGARLADRLLAGVAEFVARLLHNRRHATLLARYQGPRLAIFFKDIGPQQATAIVERTRQQVAGTSFEHEGIEVHTTLTCAVTDIRGQDTLHSPTERLETLVTRALGAGGNCTWAESHGGLDPTVLRSDS